MADYTGKSAISLAPNGEGSSGTYYKEVKWSDGFFFNEDLEKIEYITNSDHRGPIFSVDVKITSKKMLYATFHSNTSGFFRYRVGIQAWDDSHVNDVAMISTANYIGEKDNIDSNGNWVWRYKAGLDVELSMDISKLQLPIYLRLVCAGCNKTKQTTDLHGYAFYSGKSPVYDGTKAGGAYKITQGHVHIETPNAPIITKVSGTNIVVKCNPSDSAASNTGMVCDTSDTDTWYADNHTFTYKQKTARQFKAKRQCNSDCTNSDDEQWFISDSATMGKTWYIDGGCTDSTTTSLSFIAMHYPGYDGVNEITANSVDIKGALYTDVSHRSLYTNTISGTKTKNADGSFNFSFSGLNPNSNYYFRAWSDGITNTDGVLDNFVDINVKTDNMFTVSKFYAYPSATTIGAHAQWNVGRSSGVKCVVSCNGVEKTITSSGNGVGFTGLTPGNTYAVKFKFSDNDGNTVEEEISVTTYKVILISATSSTQAISLYPHSNYADSIIRSAIYSQDGSTVIKSWQNSRSDTKKIFSKLNHKTTYSCKIEIMDCYAYNEAGIQTSVNDSTFTRIIATQELLLSVAVKYIYQTQLISQAQAYVNIYTNPTGIKVVRYKDPIDGTKFSYSNLTTWVIPGGGVYRTNGITEQQVGQTTGVYEVNNSWIYSNNLPYSYCCYRVEVTITDGHNFVTASAVSHTEFPYCRLYSDNKWHKAIPYIYTDGEWKLAGMMINTNGSFHECNGDNEE